MEPVTLYYSPVSHYCEKARAVLAYKGIPFRMRDVPYNDHEAVIAASGQDYIPLVTTGDGDAVLWPDIADWAERVKPEPSIYPNGTRARARIVESWAHGLVEEAVWKSVVADVPPKLSEGQERWVFVEMQELKRGPLEIMKQRQPEFLEGVRHVCGLAQDLLGEKPFLFGDAPSLADFALYGALHPLMFTGHGIPEEFDALRTWHTAVDVLTR